MIAAGVLTALAAALCYAAAAALEQQQAAAAPTRHVVHPGLMWHVIRRPLWLAGFTVGLVGAGLHLLALTLAPLALVQPLGVTTVVFAVLLGAVLRGRRPAGGELVAGVAVAVGLGGMLSELHVPEGSPALTSSSLTTLVAATAAGIAAMVLASTRTSGACCALLLACGSGAASGLASALMRVLLHGAASTGVAAFLSWGTLAAAAAAATGLLLEQGAYKTGQLATAVAVITVVDPLVAVGVSAGVLGQPVGVASPFLAAAEALLVVVGVIVLARRIHAGPALPGTSAAPALLPAASATPATPAGPAGLAQGPAARHPRVRIPWPDPDAGLLRILIGADTYPPDVNGAAYFTRRLAHGLAARGHEVHVVCPATSRAATRGTDGPVTVHRLPSWRTPFHPTFRLCLPPGLGAGVARVAAEARPDVVHIQGHFLIGRALCRLAGRTGLPLVATNHFMPENLLPYALVPGRLAGPLTNLAWRDFARVIRRAHAVTTPTPIAADLIRSSGLVQPVTPISCGIDLACFAAHEGRRSPALFGLPDRPTLLFVGRLDVEKRIHDLIDALPLIRERVDAQLVIAGTGTQRPVLERRAHQRGVAENVHFLGFLPDADLPLVYTIADVFCMPGTAELQSLVTLEAMASSRPVVAADAVALPHLVHQARNGYRHPPGDVAVLARQVTTVLTDPALRQAMGRASHVIAREHDIDLSLRRFEQLYRDVIALIVPRRTAPRAAQPKPRDGSGFVADRSGARRLGYGRRLDRWRIGRRRTGRRRQCPCHRCKTTTAPPRRRGG
ncbi:MAG: DMT family transporter [Carbonactinosporaceae bacterium]